jgi:glycosyltransferase involved in cell wall biosynthesis
MPELVIAQPPTTNPLTGGYQYNRRMVEHAAGAAGIVERLEGAEGASGEDVRVVVLDSLWLDTRADDAVAVARRTWPGARIAWLLHGLPSMWRAGKDGPSAVERGALAAADALIAPGGFLPRLVAGRGVRVPAFVCPPGVDAALGAPGAVMADPRCLLTVATVTRAKGHDVLAAALERLPAELPWRIVGDLDTDPAFVAELRAQLPPGAELLGPRAPAEVVDEYRRAAIFVLPSRSENSPLCVREALAAGVPVVATRVGGVEELITQGVEGRLVPPDDVDALGFSILRVLAQRGQFAAAAAARGRTLPSWPAAAAAFVDAARRIASV